MQKNITREKKEAYLRANSHKNKTKSNFFRKAWKLNFAALLHIASPPARIQTACVFFLEIVLPFQEKQHFRLNLQTQFSESSLGWKSTIFIRFACRTYRAHTTNLLHNYSLSKTHNFKNIGLI